MVYQPFICRCPGTVAWSCRLAFLQGGTVGSEVVTQGNPTHWVVQPAEIQKLQSSNDKVQNNTGQLFYPNLLNKLHKLYKQKQKQVFSVERTLSIDVYMIKQLNPVQIFECLSLWKWYRIQLHRLLWNRHFLFHNHSLAGRLTVWTMSSSWGCSISWLDCIKQEAKLQNLQGSLVCDSPYFYCGNVGSDYTVVYRAHHYNKLEINECFGDMIQVSLCGWAVLLGNEAWA